MIGVVVSLDVRKLGKAGTAPRGPEVDEHVLSFVGSKIERLAVGSHSRHRKRLANQANPFASRLGRLRNELDKVFVLGVLVVRLEDFIELQSRRIFRQSI